MSYKKNYTKEEGKALIAWIDATHPHGSLDLGSGVVIRDMQLFAENMRSILEQRCENATYAGQIELFVRMKEAYEKRTKDQGTSTKD